MPLFAVPPAGSPLGFFVRSPASLGPPSPRLADNIDPETREFASLFTGMDVVDAQVTVAFGILRGTGPSVEEDGFPIPPRKITEDTPREVEALVRRALGRLITQGDIRLLDVSTSVGADTVLCTARYLNLRALDGVARTAAVSVLGGLETISLASPPPPPV